MPSFFIVGCDVTYLLVMDNITCYTSLLCSHSALKMAGQQALQKFYFYSVKNLKFETGKFTSRSVGVHLICVFYYLVTLDASHSESVTDVIMAVIYTNIITNFGVGSIVIDFETDALVILKLFTPCTGAGIAQSV